MTQVRRLIEKRFWVTIIGLFIGSLINSVGIAQHNHNSSDHMIAGPPVSDHGQMYSADILSGCDDYHCLSCSTRDKCCIDGKCGEKECGHTHAVVSCHGVPVLYLRSSGGFANCLSRGEAVVSNLNKIMSIENPEEWRFVKRSDSVSVEIWIEMIGMNHGFKIVRITTADVKGYYIRASFVQMSHEAHDIDANLVADWWVAILQDHFDTMVLGKAPSHTVATHCGKPLLKAFEEARVLVPEGSISMGIWKQVFSAKLTPTDRDRLGIVAQVVPKTFASE